MSVPDRPKFIPTADRDLLLAAIEHVGRAQGFAAVAPRSTAPMPIDDSVAAVARSSHVGYRTVTLDAGWHHRDVGPLLGVLSGMPVALLPKSSGRGYRLWRPDSKKDEPLTDSLADTLDTAAHQLYPPLDAHGALDARSGARFAFRGTGPALRIMLVAAALIGIVGLLTPLAIDFVFGSVIPADEPVVLLAVGLLLVGAALVSGAFAVVQGYAITRVTLLAQRRLQPAVWYRVVSLPASFFGRFASADLTARILAVNRLQTVLNVATISVVLVATFSLFNVGVMFALDASLALVAMVMLAGVVGVTWFLGRRIVAESSAVVAQSRANAANFSDILEGLTAIRLSGSEEVFFRQHAALVTRQVRLQAAQQGSSNTLQLAYATLLIVVPGLFFLIVGGLQWDDAAGTSTVSPVTFVAFYAAFNAVLGALLGLSTLLGPLATAGPILDGLEPIYETEPETYAQKPDPGPLAGQVEAKRLTFSYPGAGAAAVSDVSFTIEPGQFVALVGPSGAGKSTLVRLLLGFETPESGTVRYDGRDLGDIDVAAVRSQLGVVLQDARVFGGSIRNNVLGARPLPPESAWEALAAAGLADEVRAMPMQLETVVSPDGSTLSGGQIQRLIVARALVAKPAVLIFDEATSSLDDLAQAVVTDSVEALGISRLVLAHRLSTIRRADKIVVMEAGRAVQQGSFDELMEADGLFRRLAERQVV